jgi:secondary thiamine-phosphate synthase enzyme
MRGNLVTIRFLRKKCNFIHAGNPEAFRQISHYRHYRLQPAGNLYAGVCSCHFSRSFDLFSTREKHDFLLKQNKLVFGVLMFRKNLKVTSKTEGDIIDITPGVTNAVRESGVQEGLVHLFVQHSTAALTTIEYEPGVLSDLRRALSVFAPDNAIYAHNARWGDGNGRSHVKAALVGPSITIPVSDGSVMCGTWQNIVLLELDVNAGRDRTIICTVTGD